MSLVEEYCEVLVEGGEVCGKPAYETLTTNVVADVVEKATWHVCLEHYAKFEDGQALKFKYGKSIVTIIPRGVTESWAKDADKIARLRDWDGAEEEV